MTENLKSSRDKTEEYKKHLEERVDELEKFHKLAINRELRMIELKKEIASYKPSEKNDSKKSSSKSKAKEPEYCWDFWKCDEKLKQNCPAYKSDSGKECWLVATDYCPHLKNEFKTCYECPWFKKNNPLDKNA